MPTRLNGRRLWKMLALFQATYVSAPAIYYGEVGMWGADDREPHAHLVAPHGRRNL